MKTSVAVFESHEKAVASIVFLKQNAFPLRKVSLVGKAELIDDKIHVRQSSRLINAPLIAGTVLGTTIGLLSGVGLFSIPGFGFLFGSGAVIGSLGGFEVGVAAGGLVSILLHISLNEDYAVTYDEHISEGKFHLVIDGNEEEIERAKEIIGKEHMTYNIHEHRHAA